MSKTVKWVVRTPEDEYESIAADECAVKGGALVFTNGGVIELAYAPDGWESVVRDECGSGCVGVGAVGPVAASVYQCAFDGVGATVPGSTAGVAG